MHVANSRHPNARFGTPWTSGSPSRFPPISTGACTSGSIAKRVGGTCCSGPSVRHGLPAAAAAGLLIIAGVLLERPIGAPPESLRESAQVEAVAPDQAEHALQEMELMQEFSRLIHQDSAEPRM